MQLVFPDLPDITSKVEYNDGFKSLCECESVCARACSRAHSMGEWIVLKLKPLVKSFRIRSPTAFIAVYFHPNNGKIPKSNSELERKFNSDRDLN